MLLLLHSTRTDRRETTVARRINMFVHAPASATNCLVSRRPAQIRRRITSINAGAREIIDQGASGCGVKSTVTSSFRAAAQFRCSYLILQWIFSHAHHPTPPGRLAAYFSLSVLFFRPLSLSLFLALDLRSRSPADIN